MYIDSITFWTTILSGIIIGLVVGGILGLVGFVIWKRQHLYSKKLDAYTSFMNSLHLFIAVLSNIDLFTRENASREKIVDYIIENNNDFISILSARSIFIFYFGNEYYQPIEDIINIYCDLRESKDIKMTPKELDNFILDRLIILDNIKVK